ncbi:SpaA isopeptide-forming pilin-related protein [Lacticigenium naphthae]|uniref:SpaA isopeptide-forming pilin-related protein n=1 Tax=Lacticigenium naphthae TaxID=515351 RepID=UPI000426C4F5|nr:SpaA isopeptide-forming pilin-related protein [Lacticigenium naphthae]
MTKYKAKIIGLLMGLMMILSVLAPTMAMASVVPSDNARPATGDLMIHKIQYNGPTAPVITNNGLELPSLPADTKPLAGVEFTLYQVDEDAVLPIDTTGMTAYRVETSDSDGLADFLELPAGRYYVVETDYPSGVEEFSDPFLVDVPMMHPDGDRWNEVVHVYPKNQLVLGAVELTKWAEMVDGPVLPGAVFSLFHAEDDSLVQSGLTTDEYGKIFVGELEVGSYYFMETAAPTGYGLDQTKIPFEITLSNHAYNDDGLILDEVLSVELIDYDLPAIEKFVTEIDRKVDTADYFEEITWIIRPEVPTNIETYSSFKIVDTFGDTLTYLNDISITGDGVAIDVADFTASGVALNDEGGTLTIDITPSALEGVDELLITFKTHINENAVMGIDYENNVMLEFNNGFSAYTAEEEDAPYVHTGGKPFVKETKAGEGLPGAEFVIYKLVDGVKQYLDSNHDWGLMGDAHPFVSDGDGYFEVKGLAYGDYYLHETKAPEVDGIQYQLLNNDVPFTVAADSFYSDPTSIELPTATPTAIRANIVNSPEINLPQTGGMGTLVFSLLGLGLMGSSVKLYKKTSKK